MLGEKSLMTSEQTRSLSSSLKGAWLAKSAGNFFKMDSSSSRPKDLVISTMPVIQRGWSALTSRTMSWNIR